MDTESTLNIWLIHHPPVLRAREPTLESRSCPLRRMIDKNSSPGSRSVVGIEWKSSGSWESEWTKKDGDRSFLVLFFIVIRYTMSFVLMGNSKLNVRPGSRHSKYNICFYVLMVCSFVFMIVGLVFSRVLKLYAKCSAVSASEILIYAFESGCLLVRLPCPLVQSPIAY